MEFFLRQSTAVLVITVFSLCFTGCAIQKPLRSTILPNETVQVHYLCRLKNGEILTASDPSMIKNQSEPKAEIFWIPEKSAPLRLVAGQQDRKSMESLRTIRPIAFSEELACQLSEKLVNMPLNTFQQIHLQADCQDDLNKDVRYSRMGRFRKRPNKLRIPQKKYISIMKKQPAIGDEIPHIYKGFVGKITAISGDEVLVNIIPPHGGKVVQTPYGKGYVTNEGDYNKIEIDVFEGKLIRSGDNMGRVYRVDEKVFYIDYGHPFGGEELTCDVKAEALPPAAAEY